GDASYPAATPVQETLVVNPAALTITAKDESKTYGTTFTPDGTTQFSTSGLVNGDSVSSGTLTSNGYAATASVAGSPYPITPSPAAGSGLANYTINYATGNLTVGQATPSVTVMDGGTYNGNAYNAVGSAVGVDGHTAVAGSFSYTYYAGGGSTVLSGAPTNA